MAKKKIKLTSKSLGEATGRMAPKGVTQASKAKKGIRKPSGPGAVSAATKAAAGKAQAGYGALKAIQTKK
jgi:hypothetical protein